MSKLVILPFTVRREINDNDLRTAVQTDGFAILPGVLTQHEIQRLCKDLDASLLPRSRAGIRHALRHPGFGILARDPRLLDIARGILGIDAFPFHTTLFYKSPRSNWLVVWHQDTALPLRQRREVPGWGPWSVKEGVTYAHAPALALGRVLALRVHLDDSTERNGSLRVLPGTHSLGVLSDESIDNLVQEVSSVECAVPSGGILVMKPLLVHSSSKALVDAPRRVLHIEYALPETVGDGVELAVA